MTPRSRSRRDKRSPKRSNARTSPRGAAGGGPSRGAGARTASSPTPSPRYTPSRPVFRVRPTSHRIIGWTVVGLAVALAIVNDVQWGGLTLLPGGHNEGYLVLAGAVAASGAWWLGLFDRPTAG